MKTNSGFTLIELLITIAVLFILIVVAVPGYKQMTDRNRLVDSLNSLSGDLNLARSEAVKGGISVTVCASTNATACSNAALWETGWIVFSDLNGDRIVDAGTDVQFIARGALTGGLTLRTNAFANNDRIQYQPSGETGDNGTFNVCDTDALPNATPAERAAARAARARAINVNLLGRVSVATDTGGNNQVVNDANGADVVCPP